jgi:hypothetical protein
MCLPVCDQIFHNLSRRSLAGVQLRETLSHRVPQRNHRVTHRNNPIHYSTLQTVTFLLIFGV